MDGETPRDEHATNPTAPQDRGTGERICDLIGSLRRRRGLAATERPSARDTAAVGRLVTRLDPDGTNRDAVERSLAVLASWAIDSDWWAKRIRTGASFARHYDVLLDDMTIDLQRRPTRDASPPPSGPAPAGNGRTHVHDADCEHTRRVMDSEYVRRFLDLDYLALGEDERRAYATYAAAQLNRGSSYDAVSQAVVDRVTDLPAYRDRLQRDLAEYRKAHGGRAAVRAAAKEGDRP